MMKGINVGGNTASVNNSSATIACPNCGKQMPANAKFCMECGAALVNKCPNCGAEVPQGSKFCLECGTKMS